MKLKIVAVVVTGLLAANVAHAAEVYNKDGNKLDLYGKVTALRYFTDDKRDDGDGHLTQSEILAARAVGFIVIAFKIIFPVTKTNHLIIDLRFSFKAETGISFITIVTLIISKIT